MSARINLACTLLLLTGIDAAQRVDNAEYFRDTDPGAGNATPMSAFDGDYNSALEAISMEAGTLPEEGVHVLHVRAKDVNGAWSLPFRVVVEVMGGVVAFPEVRVTAAEYYMNDDPGAGLGAPMLAVDGDFGAALEAIRGGGIPVPVTAGVNVLWLRAGDANQAWGPSFGVVVNIDTTITGTTSLPSLGHASNLELAPNPAGLADGFDVILGQDLAGAELRLIDGLGQVVLSQRLTGGKHVHEEVSGIAPSSYITALVSPQVTRSKRLVLR